MDSSISQPVPNKTFMPQYSQGKIILPSTNVLQDHFLSSYTPSPHDSKFALDLLFAIQNHLPLTLFQKFFIIFMFFPLPFNWKLAIFSFLYNLPQSHFPIVAVLILVVLFIVAIYIFKYLARLRFVRTQPLVFFEPTFPSLTGKSAYATEQLFSLLHNLAGQRRFMNRLLGHKKQYSLEIAASREQGIRYILGISATDASIIQKSLLSYLPGLKIKEIKDYLPSDLRGKSRNRTLKSGVIELKLAGDFVLPLQEYKVLGEHDPIAYLTGNMTKLETDELIVFQAVVTPIMRSSHRGIVKHLRRIEQRIYQNRTLADKLNVNPLEKIFSVIWAIVKWLIGAFVAIIEFALDAVVMIFDTDRKSTPRIRSERKIAGLQEIQNPYEQQLQAEIKKKIDQPMFETSLRLLVRSSDKEQYRSRISSFLASFGSLGSAHQSLVLKSRNLRSLFQSPLLAFTTRQVSLSNNPILSTSELTDIYHFPYTETTKTEDMVKTKSQPLPAPLSFKQATTKFDNVFATNSYGGSDTPIGQTLKERQRHTYILGATGSGKTNLLSTMIYQDIINGKGVAVLDPHGQLVERLLEVIPKNRIKDVVWFAPDDDGYPIALNLLELPEAKDGKLTDSQLQKQKSLVTSSIISIIQKLYEAKYFGPRMEYVLKNAILTALETPNPTLITILDLLTKKHFRKEVVAGLENKVLKDYWVYEFEKLGSMQKNTVISPITNKIGGLLSSPINYNILSQKKSKLDFDEIMNSGKILLCDLSKGKIGEDESNFFGSLVLAKIQLAALRRALIPEEKRQDFFLYVDEFQNFATLTFSELVSEARKYHLATILAHQSISQIENRDIIKVILANVGTVICFKTANPEDEQFILPIFSPEVLKHEISNLPLYNFYMKVSVGQAEDSFLAEADNFTVKGNEKTAKSVIEQSRKRYANPAKTSSIQMIQSAEKVYHLDKSSDTEKEQFQDQKSDNIRTYPIQEGSKDGIGNKENIKKQNISSNKLTQTIPITSQQQQILSLFHRFRFIDRTQIQQFLNHKNHQRVLTWLNDLNKKKFIKVVDSKMMTKNSKAKIYCLAKNSIQFLVAEDGFDKPSLKNLYRENERSAAFVNQSQLIATIYLNLQKSTTKKVHFNMSVKGDYSSHPLESLLNDLSPQAYIEQTTAGKTESYFLLLLGKLPTKILRQRINKYLNFYQENEWEEVTAEPFPIILITCQDDEVFDYVKRYVKSKLKFLDEPDIKIKISTAVKVKEFGITGDIWTKIN